LQSSPNTNPYEQIITWIDVIAAIAKTSNKEARKITTKYTKDCILKAVSKYRQMYKKSPKKINRKVFKHSETSPLDSITDRQNNILTNPEDISKEIYIQQSISNRPNSIHMLLSKRSPTALHMWR
jgi:hypothetical protein